MPRELIDRLHGEDLDSVLAHELAHHRRGDVWMNWVEAALLSLWWFHPVIWLVRRALRQTCEDCCDDVVIGLRMASQDSYCQTLLTVAAQQSGRRPVSLRPAASPLPTATVVPYMAAARHTLARRLRRIMDGSLERSRRLSWLGLAAILALMCLLLPGLRTTQSDATAAPPEDAAAAKPEPAKAHDAGKPDMARELPVVVAADGLPVAGATVWLTQRDIHARGNPPLAVVDKGRTDATGTCRLSLPVDLINNPPGREFGVIAHQAGRALTAAEFHQRSVPKELRLELSAEATTRLTLVDPDGRPIPKATVLVGAIHRGPAFISLPEEVKAMLTAESDAQGKVELRGVSAEQVHELHVSCPSRGRQLFSYYNRVRLEDRVVLRATGAIEGRVTCDDPKRLGGLPVQIVSIAFDKQPTESAAYGYVEARTDADGRFRVPMIGDGKLIVRVWEPEDLPYRSIPLKGHAVRAGETTTVEVPLTPAVLCRGVVVESGSGKPLAGAAVRSATETQKFDARTDAEGKYQVYALPGRAVMNVAATKPYLPTSVASINVLSEGREFEMPRVELVRGVEFVGKLVDTDDKPVAAAFIHLSWGEPGSGDSTTTDEKGEFRLVRVHPTRSMGFSAYGHGIRLTEHMTVTAGLKQPFIVRVPKVEFVALSGRIVGEDGKPSGGLAYSIFHRGSMLDPLYEGKTKNDGTFETLPQFAATGEYDLRVVVGRVAVAQSDSLAPAKTGTTRFADLVFRRSRIPKEREPYRVHPLNGQIVSSKGAAVGGARVVAWYSAERVELKADADGRFRLDALPDYGGFVFIEAQGYRFFGQYVRPPADRKAVSFKLIAESEPAEAWKTLPNWVDSSKRIADQRKLMALYGENAYRAAAEEHERFRALELLAAGNPGRALEILEKTDFKEAWLKNHVRYKAGVALMAAEPEEAKAVLNAINDPDLRSYGYRDAAAKLGDDERERKLAILGEALVDARSIPGADHRAVALSDVGVALRELGQTEQGTRLLREAEALAHALATRAWPAYARGHVAKHLATLDVDSALRLVGAIEDPSEFDRHHRIVAIALSAKHPEAAERALTKIKEPRQRVAAIPGMCYYMATSDLERAKKLAAEADEPCRRAYAHGMIAQALAKSKPAEARKLLRQAFDQLVHLVESKHNLGSSIVHPQNVAAGLLPTAEAIDPTLVPECTWRVLSLRGGAAYGSTSFALGRHGDGEALRLSDPVLAACVSRYNRELARLLVQPPGDETVDGSVSYPWFHFAVLTMLDPEEAIRKASAMPEDSADQRNEKARAWQETISTLSRTPRERWEALCERQLFIWYVGQDGVDKAKP